jgi:Ribonuclease HII
MNIKEIKECLQNNITAEQLEVLQADRRSGVQKLLAAYYKHIDDEAKEAERFANMLVFEKKYWQQGIKYVAGCDEAGRGPLAGPLVVAAVILPEGIFIRGLNDSKKLSAVKREKLYAEVYEKAISITVNVVGPKDIDELNIYQATKISMEKCLINLQPYPQTALIDAMPENITGMTTESLIHGDARSASIAAASIIAKVTRDRIMIELDKEYPQYGFAGHKGYGSQSHMDAIAEFGPTKWHRRSYEPVKGLCIKQDIGEGVDENILTKLK